MLKKNRLPERTKYFCRPEEMLELCRIDKHHLPLQCSPKIYIFDLDLVWQKQLMIIKG